MTKEQLLELWKDSVLTLKNRAKELDPRLHTYDEKFAKVWREQWERVIEGIGKLDSCEQLWFIDSKTIWEEQVGLRDYYREIEERLSL